MIRPTLRVIIASLLLMMFGLMRSLAPATATTTTKAPTLELIGQIGGATQAVAVHGEVAYLGTAVRLMVFDIRDPFHPLCLAMLPIEVNDMLLHAGKLFLINQEGLTILDLAKPKQPKLVATVPLTGQPSALTIADGIIWIGDATGLIRAFSLADPLQPVEIAHFDDLGAPINDIAISQQHAYVASATGLSVLDLTTPKIPRTVGTLSLSVGTRSLAIAGQTLYLAMEGGIVLVDITTPAAPRALDFLEVSSQTARLEVIGRQLYVADGRNGLVRFDISKPEHPLLLSSTVGVGTVVGMAMQGNYGYLADKEGGLRVVYTKNSTHIAEVSNYLLPGLPWDVTPLGDKLLVVSDRKGGKAAALTVLDVSDPLDPQPLYTYDLPGLTWHARIIGQQIFVPSSTGGMIILDQLLDQASSLQFEQAAIAAQQGFLHDVAVEGNLAVLTEVSGVLHIFDISQIDQPKELSFYALSTEMWDVVLKDGYAYVAAGSKGVEIVDLRDPGFPKTAGSVDVIGHVMGIDLVGDTLYLASRQGLYIVAVDDPTAPRLVGALDLPGEATSVTVYDNYALVSAGKSGLQVVDVSDPARPHVVASYDTPGYTAAISVADDRIYVADRAGGVLIFRLK